METHPERYYRKYITNEIFDSYTTTVYQIIWVGSIMIVARIDTD